jgi:hypothetical protein
VLLLQSILLCFLEWVRFTFLLTIPFRYLPSARINDMCPHWNEHALLILTRLWIEFPSFWCCVEDKVDWVAYHLALYELFWITPGNFSESDSALLMDEFARKLCTFAVPRMIHHDIDLLTIGARSSSVAM